MINYKILCTSPINDSYIEQAKAFNMEIDCINFIEVNSNVNKNQQEFIHQLSLKFITAVVTSVNAVKAIKPFIDVNTNWNFYCIEPETKNAIIKYFPKSTIIATAPYGNMLASLIKAHAEKEVYFFCGNKRRDDVPNILREHNIRCNEMVVYETVEKPQTIQQDYDGILFFSPSAVQSFFELNKIKEHTRLFAIGTTTAEAIKKFSSNKIYIADSPSKKQVFTRLLSAFNSSTL